MLVIIGLIVGGVLVGQDLIRAAAVRAQMTQIEKYNQAANAFYGKYGYLPGDIPAVPAAQFGFASRGQYAGEGDGNGVLEGVTADGPGNNLGLYESAGETLMFWVDLSAANLIQGGFNSVSATTYPVNGIGQPGSGLGPPYVNSVFPQAKIGNGNYVYVYSTANEATYNPTWGNGINCFCISQINYVWDTGPTGISSAAGITVAQAYAIDTKTDDGLPMLGRIIATFPRAQAAEAWAGNSSAYPGTATTAGSSTTCFDNSANTSGTPGVFGATQHYSLEMNNGANVTCALSIRMQAGD